jgi:putative DNA primase/helicase
MDALGDYAMQAAPDLLIAKEGPAGGPNNDVAELQGARFVATVEVEDGKRMAEGLVKQITGDDIIKARFMRENFFEFKPTHKIFLAANHMPAIRGQDFAIWRRIKLVPFDAQFKDPEDALPGEQVKDKDLPAKLRAELPGILPGPCAAAWNGSRRA